ncbi:MAG: hypothetical protein R3F29_07910 [Planctomycetota bacterium]
MSPTLAQAPAPAAFPAPRPHGAPPTAAALQRGYRRDYEVRAPAGTGLLQRVRVHIRYRCGGQVLVDYRQTYFEFFRFRHGEPSLIDTHDFDLSRDGWRQAGIVALVRRHRAPGCPLPSGEPVVDVQKQFTIAVGEVVDARLREHRPGAWFGLLASGPGGPSRTVLRIARGDGTTVTRDDLRPCPPGSPIAGHGVFATDSPPAPTCPTPGSADESAATSGGWRAFEHYRHHYANQLGVFADRGGYVPTHAIR